MEFLRTITSGDITIQITDIDVCQNEARKARVRGIVNSKRYTFVFETKRDRMFYGTTQYAIISSSEPYLKMKIKIPDRFDITNDSKYFSFSIPFKKLSNDLDMKSVQALANKLNKLSQAFCKRKEKLKKDIEKAGQIIKEKYESKV